MKSYIKVITTPSADTNGLALLLHFDSKRYLIGSLAEGLQRASVQRGVRLNKMNECFMTGRTEWQNTGGVIGMILTMADVISTSKTASAEESVRKIKQKAEKLGISSAYEVNKMIDAGKPDNDNSRFVFFTPPNMNHQLATARRFVFRKGMPVDVHELDAQSTLHSEGPIEPYWSDQNIKVWPMSILPGPAPPRPANSRKRSFEMMEDVQNQNATIVSDDIPEAEHYRLVVKSIVSEMFNSSWRLDTLYETKLADVRMPATIFIRNNDTHKIEKYEGPMPGGAFPLPDPNLTVLVRKPWPGALIESLPPATPAKEALSYIFRTHTKRGKFDPEKAKELKVPPGPMYSKLTNGESVMNTDGEVITSDQVLGPSQPGSGFAIVDLPDQSYIDNILARPEWKDESVIEGVRAIFWSCGQHVLGDPRIKTFMEQLSKVQHIVSSADQCPNQITFDSAATALTKLRQLDPKRFSELTYDTPSEATLPNNVLVANRGQLVHIEPKLRIDIDEVPGPLDLQAIIDGVRPEVYEEANLARTSIAADQAELDRWASTLPGKDVEITTLGTGSALPSKYRNVSSTLMRVPGWGSVLFDCGENTIGQLRRAYSSDEFNAIIAELRVIVISHMHADHHLGTVSVIKAWYRQVHGAVPETQPSLKQMHASSLFAGQSRLAILAEPAMQNWLWEYAAIEDYGYSRLAPMNLVPEKEQMTSKLRWFIPPSELRTMSVEQRQHIVAQADVSAAVLGLSDVQAVLVKHCQGARAVSLTWPDGFKASYSGDCRPSEAFSRIGQGSTVCIHEATFDDELRGDAEAKHHSTTSEALRVAQKMGARTCVLTHFSQRYQKIPILEHASEAEPVTQPVQISNGDVNEDTDNASFDDAEPNGTVTYARQQVDDGGQTYELPREDGGKAEAVKIKLTTDMKVCVAFDLMRVKVGEIAEMQYFTPALLKLLEDSDVVEQANGSATAKTSKRRN